MSNKNNERLRVVFFGLGSIGKRHAKLIRDNFDYQLYAYRSRKNNEKNRLGMKEVYSFREIEQLKPDAAFITNPTSEHIEYALFCVQHGINLFIEKPLSNNKKGLTTLAKTIKKNKIKSYTAYCLRFHPIIKWLKKYIAENKPLHVTINASSYLPNWRKGNPLDYYSAHKKMGGGVILDLSHEIDYLYFLLGYPKNIKVNSKKIGDVTADAEDFVDILMEFSDIYCNLHLNFLSRLKRREVILNFKDGTIVADLIKNKIRIINDNKEKEIHFHEEMDDIYLEQLRYFFANPTMNNIDESMNVFNIITKIKEEAK